MPLLLAREASMPQVSKLTGDLRKIGSRSQLAGNQKDMTQTLQSKGSVLDRIKPIGFDQDAGIKMLLYGRSGTGKTTLWATFPKPILAIVCSGSDQPGELRSIDTPEYRKHISQVVLDKSSEVLELAANLTLGGFRTVVLDHASGLQDLVLKEILGLDELPQQKTWGLANQQQYGQLGLRLKDLLRGLLNLSCNVVVVAQEREFNVDTTSDLLLPYVGAGLTPSTTGWLNTAVDYICQTYIRQREEEVITTIGQGKAAKQVATRQRVKGVEYALRTAPDPVFTTKFRLPRGRELPDAIVDPTYDKLMNLIRGG